MSDKGWIPEKRLGYAWPDERSMLSGGQVGYAIQRSVIGRDCQGARLLYKRFFMSDICIPLLQNPRGKAATVFHTFLQLPHQGGKIVIIWLDLGQLLGVVSAGFRRPPHRG